MKTMFLAFCMLKKRKLLNFVLISELSIVLFLLIIYSNLNVASKNNINVFKNRSCRVLYYMDWENASVMGANPQTDDDIKKLSNILSEFSFVKGFSKEDEEGLLYLGKEKITNKNNLIDTSKLTESNSSKVLLMDNDTINSIYYPLSSGKWIGTDLVKGYIPCVIGGYMSKRYHIGDKFVGTALKFESNGLSAFKEYSFVVTGILAQPNQVLSLDTLATHSFPISELFTYMIDEPMFILFSKEISDFPSENMSSCNNHLIYIDKNTPESEISKLAKKLTIKTDNELINSEIKENTENYSIILPYIIMMFLVSSVGIVAISLFTTINNLRKFSVYYLTGCSRFKTILIIAVYSLYYFIFSVIMLFAIKLIAGALYYQRTINYYFIIYFDKLWYLFAIVLLICLISFILPAKLISRKNVTNVLKSN